MLMCEHQPFFSEFSSRNLNNFLPINHLEISTRIRIPWKFIPVSFSLFLMLVPAFASTTAPPIVVMGSDNVAKTMAYTAYNNNGRIEKNPDFEITQNNVVSVLANGKLTLLSTNGLGFSKAQITDANQKTTDVPIVNNQVTFTTPGVFTFTVVSGQYAYTCIVVVGEQPKQNIDKQISNTYIILEISVETTFDDCEGNECEEERTHHHHHVLYLQKDGKCSPLPDPRPCSTNIPRTRS